MSHKGQCFLQSEEIGTFSIQLRYTLGELFHPSPLTSHLAPNLAVQKGSGCSARKIELAASLTTILVDQPLGAPSVPKYLGKNPAILADQSLRSRASLGAHVAMLRSLWFRKWFKDRSTRPKYLGFLEFYTRWFLGCEYAKDFFSDRNVCYEFVFSILE